MSDYINRDIAIARLTALEVKNPIATMCDAKRVLADMPGADTVEVVRCKDCKYASEFDGYEDYVEQVRCCTRHEDCDMLPKVWPDDFCSYGERRDNDGRRSD